MKNYKDNNNNTILYAQPIANTADDNKLTSPRKTNKRKYSLFIIEAATTLAKTSNLQTDSAVSDNADNNNNRNSLESTLTEYVIETLQIRIKNNNSNSNKNSTTKDVNEHAAFNRFILIFFYYTDNKKIMIDYKKNCIPR